MFLSPQELRPTEDEPAKTVINQRGAELVRHHVPPHVREAVGRVTKAIEGEYHHEPEIWVYGKLCHQPRDLQFRSDESKGYFYSGQVAESQPLTEDMKAIIQWANSLVGAEFNGILINRYTDGTKTVGAHADSEAGLDASAGVLAISHGVERKFRIRDKHTKQIVKDVPARQGEAIQMKGAFQSVFTHEIPKEAAVRGERVSLTFRRHDVVAERKLWDKHMHKVAEKKRVTDARIASQLAMRDRLNKLKEERAVEFAEDIANRVRMKRQREEKEEAQAEHVQEIKRMAKDAKKAEAEATKPAAKPAAKV